ncbi:geranylgeranyl transferase type-2 subunit beta 1-like protein [Babesia caballi]|uniref:Geranylgeranyl transferase type-2 subunit beta n=1 Tax=Babesia caballi TaxID=5871 RepID=A0AAV4LYC3_BABCB|nr:geranylgeranyl transferase type-2 subunit beta 1-like protein [Babesia caballi]
MEPSLHLDRKRVYDFLLNNLNDRLTIEGFAYEPIKVGGIYWTLTAIALLKDEVNDIFHPKLGGRLEDIAFNIIDAARNADGGFGNAPGHPSSVIATHVGPYVKVNNPSTQYALLVLCLLGRQDIIDRKLTAGYISGLQNLDGSFNGDLYGEADARHVYSSVICLSMLDALDAVDVGRTVRFLLTCQNYDGGFGWYPNGESHAAAAFCCVGALCELDALHLVNLDALGAWLAERQTAGGGCNGRAEKAPDICYSWWVLSALNNIGRFEWFEAEKLTGFVAKSQNKEDGGIAYFPGFMGDVFHTFFALAALSLVDHERFGLAPVHPRKGDARNPSRDPLQSKLSFEFSIPPFSLRQLGIETCDRPYERTAFVDGYEAQSLHYCLHRQRNSRARHVNQCVHAEPWLKHPEQELREERRGTNRCSIVCGLVVET